MSYLGILEALKARLAGNPPQYVAALPNVALMPRPVAVDHLPLGRVAHPGEERATVPQQATPTAQLGARLRVPVLRIDKSANAFPQVYPAFFYSVIGFEPNFSGSVYDTGEYQGDYAWDPVLGSEREVFDGAGISLGTSARTAWTRAVEHPFDIMVEIRAYSKREDELTQLTEYLWRTFPPRHFIRVARKDGSWRSCNMLWKDFQHLDSRQAVADGTPGVEREYGAVWTYLIEGFLDTTDQAKLQELTRVVQVDTSET